MRGERQTRCVRARLQRPGSDTTRKRSGHEKACNKEGGDPGGGGSKGPGAGGEDSEDHDQRMRGERDRKERCWWGLKEGSMQVRQASNHRAEPAEPVREVAFIRRKHVAIMVAPATATVRRPKPIPRRDRRKVVQEGKVIERYGRVAAARTQAGTVRRRSQPLAACNVHHASTGKVLRDLTGRVASHPSIRLQASTSVHLEGQPISSRRGDPSRRARRPGSVASTLGATVARVGEVKEAST
jgi:hypothetical protein